MFDAEQLTIDGKSVAMLTIDGGVVWGVLPAGYTYLDYIESNGTQYIDTGVKADQDTRMVCNIMWMGNMNGFGARSAVATRNFSVRVIDNKWQLGYGSDGGVTTGTIKAEKKWQIVDINKNELYVDGEFSISRPYVEFTTAYNLAIGAIKAGSLYYGYGKYRSCQIYDDGVIVRNFIPCKDADGTVGMYDTVNDKFYGSSGTGEFIAGEL